MTVDSFGPGGTVAHLFFARGAYAWSGFNASGDPTHEPWALVVEVGRSFHLTGDDRERPLLYLTGRGPMQFQTFTPGEFALAARLGYFGFEVLVVDQAAAEAADLARRAAARRRRKRGS